MRAIAWQTMSVLLAVAFGAFAQSSSDARATLLCRLQSQDGSVHVINLVVDYEKGTVNGNQAHITDGSMTWTSRSDKYNLEWVVNRYTGQANTTVRDSSADPSPAGFSGTCARATEKKF